MQKMNSENSFPYEGPDDYVFASYAHEDRPVVVSLLKKLHDKGLRVWYDEGNKTKDNWSANIEKHLVNATSLIVFVTEHSVSRVWIVNEVRLMLPSYDDETNRDDGTNRIIPIHINKIINRKMANKLIANQEGEAHYSCTEYNDEVNIITASGSGSSQIIFYENPDKKYPEEVIAEILGRVPKSSIREDTDPNVEDILFESTFEAEANPMIALLLKRYHELGLRSPKYLPTIEDQTLPFDVADPHLNDFFDELIELIEGGTSDDNVIRSWMQTYLRG
jgi:hypothetical protein